MQITRYSTKPFSGDSSLPSPRASSRRNWLNSAALGLVLLALCCSLLSCGTSRAYAPKARQGVMDLRFADLAALPPLALDGEWEFEPGISTNSLSQKIYRTVPDIWEGDVAGESWGLGYGTYRLRVLLPEKAGPLGISYTTVATAFELDVNGETLAHAGLPRPEAAIAQAAYAPGVAAMPEGLRELDLTIRVSNHEYRGGGIWRSFYIGSLKDLQVDMRNKTFITLGLASFMGALTFIYLIIFVCRPKDWAHLWFTLLAFILAMRLLLTGEYLMTTLWERIPFDLLIRLEYCTVFLSVPTAILMLLSLYPEIKTPFNRRILLLPFVPFVLSIPFLPLPILTRIVFVFYVISFPAMAATAWVLVRAIFKRIPGSLLMFTGGVILMAAGINDMLYASFAVRTGNLFPWGLAAFAGLLAASMARNFARTYNKVEHLVLEVHHRVKNSLQIVSSLMTLQSISNPDEETRQALGIMRDKIRAISLVQERLHNYAGREEIDLGAYLEELAELLVSSLHNHAQPPAVAVHAEHYPVTGDFCIDCGLMVSELVTNIFKHGDPGTPPQVDIRLYSKGFKWLVLEVRDTGPGFPKDFEKNGRSGQGFTIVETLVKNQKGRMEILENTPKGALVRLTLKVPASR